MKKFEYITHDYVPDLNHLGNNGWELVSHTVTIYKGVVNQFLIFKREKNQ